MEKEEKEEDGEDEDEDEEGGAGGRRGGGGSSIAIARSATVSRWLVVLSYSCTVTHISYSCTVTHIPPIAQPPPPRPLLVAGTGQASTATGGLATRCCGCRPTRRSRCRWSSTTRCSAACARGRTPSCRSWVTPTGGCGRRLRWALAARASASTRTSSLRWSICVMYHHVLMITGVVVVEEEFGTTHSLYVALYLPRYCREIMHVYVCPYAPWYLYVCMFTYV